MKYKYKSDLEKFNTSLDIWEIIKPNENGIYEGDCESYCRTIKNLYKDTYEDFNYYYCLLDGVGHCVLIEDNCLVIDCNTQEIWSLQKYKETFNVTGFKKYNWFQITSKILLAKIFLFIKGY